MGEGLVLSGAVNEEHSGSRRHAPGQGPASESPDVQEWLVHRYRYLRRELEEVDREIVRLRRRMQLQAQRREAYMQQFKDFV